MSYLLSAHTTDFGSTPRENAYSIHTGRFRPRPECGSFESVAILRAPFEREDRPIVEGIARNMGEASFWDLKPVLLQIDTAAVLARRILAKKIEAEQGVH